MSASAAGVGHTRRIPTVVIVGGGFSGAAVALHLGRLAPGAAQLVVIEPQREIGRGLAYGTTDADHRINVPTTRMQVFADDPDHFDRWYANCDEAMSDRAALASHQRIFSSRRSFGSYMVEQIARLRPGPTHLRTRATAIARIGDGFRVSCADGQIINADAVVLAVCHPPPAAPPALRELASDTTAVISDPWQPGAFDQVGADERILIVGTGLTMADILATLARRGHRGSIIAISRRGQRSQGHVATPADPFGDFLSPPSVTARTLLARIRANVAEAARHGLSWHGVLDQVRLQGSAIWRALPLAERRRLLRHLRPFWDTHRFRIAPQIEQTMARQLASRQLAIRAASLRQVERSGAALQVTLRDRRHGRDDQVEVDRIVLATGPAHGGVFRDDPLLANLLQAGLAHPDPLGLGIDVDTAGRTISERGLAEPGLFVASPLARGTFGELMGVPDVSLHARHVAEAIDDLLARRATVSRSA